MCSDGLYGRTRDKETRVIANAHRRTHAARKLARSAVRRRGAVDIAALVVQIWPQEPLWRIAGRQILVCSRARAASAAAPSLRRDPVPSGFRELPRLMGGPSLALLVVCVVLFWLGGT